MACKNCSSGCLWNIRHTCKCCQVLDGNTADQVVCWCDDCRAYICKACYFDEPRRAQAFTVNLASNISEGNFKEAGRNLAGAAKYVSGKIIDLFKDDGDKETTDTA